MELRVPVPSSNPAFDKDYDKDYSEIPADPDYLTTTRDEAGYEMPLQYDLPKYNQNTSHDRYVRQPMVAGSGHSNQQFQTTTAGSGHNNQQFQPTTAGSGHHPKQSDLSISGSSQPVKQNIEVGTGQTSHRKWRCIAIVLVVLCVLLIVGILLAYFLPEGSGSNTRNQQDYTGGCDGEWLRTDSMRSVGGLAIVSDSAATCQRICEDMFECLAVDKHTQEDLCWLHTQPNYSTERKPDGKFTQYILQERCNRYQGSICMVMSPCENGATCEASSRGQYSCICPRHCSGVHCQTCGCPIDFLTGEVSNLRMKIGTVEKTVPVYVETGPVGDIWIVLMRRKDGSEDFANRNWTDYKEGFGDLNGEFWLGNDIIHALTNNGSEYILRIDMRAWTGECRYAEYSSFRIGAESEKYQLHVKGYSGTAEDSLTAGFRDDYTNHNNNFFSTYDVDNDENDELNCALDNTGGWWYTDCFYSKLTGEYGQEVGKEDGISWEAWLGLYNYLQYADLKIQVRL